ncbi:hypothetical protein ABPG77_007127 [Micractinium sp. CCAP 211/92]
MARFQIAGGAPERRSTGLVKGAAIAAGGLFVMFLVLQTVEMDGARMQRPLMHISRLQQTLASWAWSGNSTAAATAADDGGAAQPDSEPKPEEPKPEEPKPEERKPEEPKPEEPKPEEPKPEEPKPEEPKPEEPKPEEPKPAEPKPEEPKPEEPKPEEPKQVQPPKADGPPDGDVFAGPTLDLSGLPTIFSAMVDHLEENSWLAKPAEAARRSEL